MLLSACSQEDAIVGGGELLTGIRVTIEDAGFGETRSSYVVDPSLGFVSLWTAGDVIGIYPVGGDQVAFPISEGEGTATASFDGGAWALRADRQYAAYYPFSADNYTVSESAIPVSYTGQVQTGNGSTAHLGQYDYLAAPAVQPNGSGSVDLEMKHLGAFVRLQLTMPKAATLVSAKIESDGTQFVTAGRIDLTALKPAIAATSTAASITLGLSGITCAADEVVTLYYMVAPANLGSSELTITLTDNGGKTYKYVTTGSNYTAGKSYSYTITETSGGTGATIPSAGWDTENNTNNGHAYVDLGITSNGKPLYWATCNVGATNPVEYGYYFAWGETKAYGEEDESNDRNHAYASSYKKTYYDWCTYKWMKSGKSSWQYINKYTKKDGQTSGCWYDGDGNFIGDGKTVLDPEDDAAVQNWGGDWRMPTDAEMTLLRNQCYWEWTDSYNGKKGYIVYKAKSETHKGKYNTASLSDSYSVSDVHIFLPAAGYRDGDDLFSDGSFGYYWSSSLDTSYSNGAYYMSFYSSDVNRGKYSRYGGLSVRPVCQ